MGVLDNRHALITGGGTGIGAAIARALAREGAAVSLAGRRRTPLENVATGLAKATAIVADVTKESDCAAMASAARKAHGSDRYRYRERWICREYCLRKVGSISAGKA